MLIKTYFHQQTVKCSPEGLTQIELVQIYLSVFLESLQGLSWIEGCH